MTIQEVKLDIINRHFFIAERSMNSNGLYYVELVISKLDTDSLSYVFTQPVTEQNYIWEEVYINTIKNIAYDIDVIMINRHAQNINTCQHDLVMVGCNKVCKRCMGKFGQTIPVNLTFN